MPDNQSLSVSWLDKIIKRYKDTGNLIPVGQDRLYRLIARDWAAGRTVVDIGSSIGYGSNILAHEARFVWGIDVCPESIDFAVKVFKRPNLDFAVLDIEQPPTRGISKFEVVVMCEVIEHLSSPEAGLDMVKRLLAAHGVAFITAPNINNPEVKERDAANSLHISHWTAGEFYALLTKHFQAVTLYSVDKLAYWTQEETIDGNSTDGLIVAKCEGVI